MMEMSESDEDFAATPSDVSEAATSEISNILPKKSKMQWNELTRMAVDDIEDMGSVLIVKVSNSKIDIQRTFAVTNSDYIKLYRKFGTLRRSQASNRRFFLKYHNDKCVDHREGDKIKPNRFIMARLCLICLILISLIFIEASSGQEDKRNKLYSGKVIAVAKSTVGSGGMDRILNRHRRAFVTEVPPEETNTVVIDTRPCRMFSFFYGCICRVGESCSSRRQHLNLSGRYHG
ncbi:hypothetical protein ILUMI_27141 [Ignelater luminosus]|uniref:Uncharacterized protein n=1 Tax=Ignelater luminosus TaxID=2038154 RepID=A0A8K0C5F2_IGNLU|nr:hypothetical protein ILUMI_27141 [Ignelater luminosus]